MHPLHFRLPCIVGWPHNIVQGISIRNRVVFHRYPDRVCYMGLHWTMSGASGKNTGIKGVRAGGGDCDCEGCVGSGTTLVPLGWLLIMNLPHFSAIST